MALIICPECGGKMSDTASSCPHCGFNRNAYAQRQQREQAIMDKLTAAPDRIGVDIPYNLNYPRSYLTDDTCSYGVWEIQLKDELRRIIREPRIVWKTIYSTDGPNSTNWGGLHFYDIGPVRTIRIQAPRELKSISPIILDVQPGHIYEYYFTDAATGRELDRSEKVDLLITQRIFDVERKLVPHVRIKV